MAQHRRGWWGLLTRGRTLYCRWVGHDMQIEHGWAYCTRCAWREALWEAE